MSCPPASACKQLIRLRKGSRLLFTASLRPSRLPGLPAASAVAARWAAILRTSGTRACRNSRDLRRAAPSRRKERCHHLTRLTRWVLPCRQRAVSKENRASGA